VSILLAACTSHYLAINPTIGRSSEWIIIRVSFVLFIHVTFKLAARLCLIILSAAPPDCTAPSGGMCAARPIKVLVVFVLEFTILAGFLSIIRLTLLVA
jgi:hypothetical protein